MGENEKGESLVVGNVWTLSKKGIHKCFLKKNEGVYLLRSWTSGELEQHWIMWIPSKRVVRKTTKYQRQLMYMWHWNLKSFQFWILVSHVVVCLLGATPATGEAPSTTANTWYTCTSPALLACPTGLHYWIILFMSLVQQRQAHIVKCFPCCDNCQKTFHCCGSYHLLVQLKVHWVVDSCNLLYMILD